ncbi:hypothetical protein AB0E81_26150 [Streptomyces sp. NPDC033538]|uniref:hypothetical protein n=1 Tax=Streptomyces sp. NPDC033538 TaxID=3155367 RepID=UPI0033C442EF
MPVNTPHWVTPRRLGAAAAVYGVFVAGWYLGQPVTPECHVDQAALDRIIEEHEAEASPSPSPTPTVTAFPNHNTLVDAHYSQSLTVTAYAVTCTNDTSERPRLGAWLEGRLQ